MNYSEYWRVNKSVVEYVELANALRAMRKIVALMDVDAEVVWSGMPSRAQRKIELPSVLAMGDYPIPAEKMDIITGFNIHEAFHHLEESEHAWGYLCHSLLTIKDRTLLSKLFEAGEDIHVDGVALRKGLPGKYVRKSRIWWKSNYQDDYTQGMATPEGLFGIWSYLVLDVIYPEIDCQDIEELLKLPCAQLEQQECESLIEAVCCGKNMSMFQVMGTLLSMTNDYMEALEMLLAKTPDIIRLDAVGRALCYRELWQRLVAHFTDWEAKIKAAGELSQTPSLGGASVDETKISAELAEKIQQAVASEAEDVTEAIKAALKSVGAASEIQHLYPAIYDNALDPLEKEPNLDLVRNLSEIFRLWLEETLHVNRGLDAGTIDARRLHKVATTGHIFRQREYHHENIVWHIIVLIDTSASVAWFWPQIQGIYSALASSLRGDNIKLEVLAYRETADTCQIRNLFYNNRLYTLEPEGDTPSGEAIVATALRVEPGCQNLVIHITDGLKNVGLPVEYALDYCKKQGVDLVTIGVGQAGRAFSVYGDSFELLGASPDKLPHAVAALLKRKLVRQR